MGKHTQTIHAVKHTANKCTQRFAKWNLILKEHVIDKLSEKPYANLNQSNSNPILNHINPVPTST